MQIDLTPEQQDFVRQAVESGRFRRAEDAVQAAMTLWVDQERRRTEILAAVDIAKASIRRGEGIEITQQSMGALARDVKIGVVSRRESGGKFSLTSS
jgi:Arc/MetJ-type ribon-helix-helix transcriptional regulator